MTSEGVAAIPRRNTRLRWVGAVMVLSGAIATLAWTATLLGQAGSWEAILNDEPAFSGWQLDLMAGGLLALALAVAALSIAKIMRLRQQVPLTPPSRGLLALVGAVGGALILGSVGSWGAQRAMVWASNHTAAAGRSAAEDRAARVRELGDATHPPRPFDVPARRPVPAAITARLLRPTDLGTGWYAEGTPRGGTAAHYPDSPRGERTTAAIDLAQEKWNGRTWVQHVHVSEIAAGFTTAKLARSRVTSDVRSAAASPPNLSAPQVVSTRIGGQMVWRVVEPAMPSGDRSYYVSVGSIALRLFIDIQQRPVAYLGGPIPRFRAVTYPQVLAAAIHRAEAAQR